MGARRATLFLAALFLLSLLIFLRSACASLYPDDSGETVTLAWTLSIGHPPGYPLHTLLSRAWTLIPLGDPALRMNFFAAFLAAGSVALLAGLLLALGAHALAAAFVALGFALGPVHWHNAGVAKGSIYGLNNLITLGCLFALAVVKGRRGDALFFLLFGMGLAHHYMSQMVMVPAYGVLMWDSKGIAPLRRFMRGGVFVIPGLSLYAYLFIRAAQNPPVNWGHIRTLDDFWFFLTRAQYAAGEITRGLGITLGQFKHAAGLLLSEGRWILPALALPAIWLAFKKRRPVELSLTCALLATYLAVGLYLNLSGERLDIMQPYLFPAYLAQATLAGLTLSRLQLAFEGPRRWALTLGLAAALAAAGSMSWKLRDKSQYHFALDNAKDVLNSLPRNAALFAAGDAVIFPIWYLQEVKRLRLDVALVGTPVLPMDWVRDDLARRYPAFLQPRIHGAIGAESIDRLVWTLLEMNQGRLPLYFSYNKLNEGVRNWRLLPRGDVYLALPQSAPDPDGISAYAEARLKSLVTRGFETRPLDPRTLKLLVGDHAIHHNALGVWYEDHKDYLSAYRQYSLAASLHPESEEFPYNQGNALHSSGRKEEALARYEYALMLNPRYEDAWYNLAVTFFMLNRDADGCAALKNLLKINPKNSGALSLRTRCPNLQ